MPRTLQILDSASSGLPALPSVPLTLHTAEAAPSAAVARLKDILLDTVRSQIAGG